MSTMPLVSVVIPAYNSSDYILDAIDSIFSQDYSNVEIIVVNDGSTDNTLELLAPLQDRIILINQENAGSASARNRGMEAANGKYIAFLDADDLWLPGKLALQVEYIEAHPDVGMVYSGWKTVSDNAEIGPLIEAASKEKPGADVVEDKSGWIYNKLLLSCIVHTTTVLVRREIVQKAGFFDLSLRRGQDYDYWIRVSVLTPIVKLRPVLSIYRIHDSSITNRPHDVNYGAVVIGKAIERFGYAAGDGEPADTGAVRNKLAQLWFDFGYMHYKHPDGNRQYAKQGFWRCLRLRPLQLRTWALLLLVSFGHGEAG